jgi:hypothetical protein
MKRNFIIAWLTFLLILTFSFSTSAKQDNWYFDNSDHEVLKTLKNEIAGLNGNVTLLGPFVKEKSFNGFTVELDKGGKKDYEIVGVSFNGFDVLPGAKIKRWESDGRKKIEIKYDTGHLLREGIYYFIVKYMDPQFNNTATSAYVLLYVNDNGERNEAEKLIIDKRIPKIFGNLYKTQQKLKSFSARLTGYFESYFPPDPPVIMDFTGKFTAIGWNRFSVVLSAPPTYTVKAEDKTYITKDQKWKEKFPKAIVVDRNHLGAFNLVYYIDYFAILDNYNWEIAGEDKNEITLRGWANELLQTPYQYLIKVDKKRWVPLAVQTFLDKETVVSLAIVDYQKINRIDVPVRQVTSSKYAGGYFQEYTLDLSREIETNKESPEKGGSI